jgi:hypothetical protein
MVFLKLGYWGEFGDDVRRRSQNAEKGHGDMFCRIGSERHVNAIPPR